ncbi:MAG: hypothetical protein GY760_15970 [Deltaproteobacteria bacterium]|nr:hypothetical protein [Deltaproteobacteria bacterium]
MPRKKKVYTDITLNELSNVDKPAQAPAKALIIKRATDEEVLKAEMKTEDGKKFPSKDFAYTPDKNKPSTWKLRLTSTPGGKPDPRIVGAATAALGKGFRGNKVQIPAAALSGVKNKVRAAWKKANPDKSTDEIPSVLKKGVDMSEFTQADLDAAVKKAVEDVTVKLTKSESLAKMNDSQKVFYNDLDESGKGSFLKMSSDDMNKEIEKVKKSDDSFIADGKTIRKSTVGEEVFALLKSQNDRIEKAEKDSKEAIEKSKDQVFQKKASEMFKNLPGTPETQGAVLKAIDSMEEDVKKTITEMLKAGENGMTTEVDMFKSYGDDGEIVITKKDDKEQGSMAILQKKYKKK